MAKFEEIRKWSIEPTPMYVKASRGSGCVTVHADWDMNVNSAVDLSLALDDAIRYAEQPKEARA